MGLLCAAGLDARICRPRNAGVRLRSRAECARHSRGVPRRGDDRGRTAGAPRVVAARAAGAGEAERSAQALRDRLRGEVGASRLSALCFALAASRLANQCNGLPAYLGQLRSRNLSLEPGLTRLPIQALHLVGEYHVRFDTGDHHLERIALHLCRHRAAQHQARTAIVRGGAQHKRGSVTRLLVPSLGLKIEPNDLAGVRHVRHQNDSFPAALPKLTSACRFSGVIPAMRAFTSYRRIGSITMRPASSRTSTGSSRCNFAASMTAAGMRTEALLPHFFTVTRIASYLRMYRQCR